MCSGSGAQDLDAALRPPTHPAPLRCCLRRPCSPHPLWPPLQDWEQKQKEQRERILTEWTKRYDGKSEKR